MRRKIGTLPVLAALLTMAARQAYALWTEAQLTPKNLKYQPRFFTIKADKPSDSEGE